MAAKRSSRRWQLMADDLTDSQPSPVAARQSLGSTVLQRRGTAAQRNERIQQHMAELDKVVNTTPPTSRSVGLSSLSYTPGSLLKERFRQEHHTSLATPTDTPPLVSISHAEATPRHLSIMDETGMSHNLHLHFTPAHDMTVAHHHDDAGDCYGSHWDQNTSILDTTAQPTSQADATISEDLITHVSDELVTAFHRCVSEHRSPGQVLELFGAFRESCSAQIKDLKTSGVYKSSQYVAIMTDLLLEMSTWELAEVLFTDRLESEAQEEEEEEVMEEEMRPRTDKQIADDFFMKNKDVRQAQLVVDWLEQNANNALEDFPLKAKYFADSFTWENTLHDIKHGLNVNHIVTEMDPDAPTRQNKKLSDLDERDEESLVKHLFILVRAGQLQKAQELCVECKQPWRAATLDGWKLYHDPNLGKRVGDSLESVEGTASRDLWKLSCWEMAKDSFYSVHEKAIYAALSGNLAQLLPACQSWYDCLWAYFKVIVDVLVEQKLRASLRYPTNHTTQELPDEYWTSLCLPDQIFQDIEAFNSDHIQRQSKLLYHVVEKHIITGSLDVLVETMHSMLGANHQATHLHQLRFMAHVVLFVRHLGLHYDVSLCNDILQAYVERLIQNQFIRLVALYCTFLPPKDQVVCYAKMLEEVSKPDKQKLCLQLAKDVGLDVAAITKTVVETIRKKGFEDVPVNGKLELGYEVELTELDNRKIMVISWLVYEESHRAEAIHQANALIRAFLAVKKHVAAKHVFDSLPNDSIEIVTKNWQMKSGEEPLPRRLANDIREYMCIKTYLDAHQSFSVWFQEFHQFKPVAPVDHTSTSFTEQVAMEQRMKLYQEKAEQWRNQTDIMTNEVENKIYNVLLFVEGGWMKDEQSGDDDEEENLRRRQMAYLRQLCLPQLCFLLHNVLHSTHQYQKCMEIANVIASERHQLYKEFHPDELQRLLQLLHNSSLCMLESADHDPLGYDLAVVV